MNWNGKKVFATGLSGFIGSHLFAKLKSLGADMYVNIHTTPFPNPVENGITNDLTKESDVLRGYLHDVKPEIIFHLAAQPLVSVAGKETLETLKTNVDGTYNLLEACKNLPSVKSFVHISTDKVMGNTRFIDENTPVNGATHPYNASKAAGDTIAQMYSNFFDIPMVVIRNANVYGAGDKHFDRIVPRVIKKALSGEPPVIRGDGSNTRDFIHVNDVVDAYLLAAELPYKEKLTTINVGGFNRSVWEVVHSVLEKTNRIDLSPKYEKQWKGEIPHQSISKTQAYELLSWLPKIDLDEGLDLTIPWYKEFLNA